MEAQEQPLPIRLASMSFDPLQDKPEYGAERPVQWTPGPSTRSIVQFTKALTRQERARLQGEYGLTLTNYVPEYAYVENVRADVLQRLTRDPLFRSMVPYAPDFKIAEGIGERAFRTSARQRIKGLWLRVILFPDADPDHVLKALDDIGATDVRVIDNRPIGGAAEIRFIVTAKDELGRIAHIDEVRWIEEVGESKPDNGTTAGTIQSGVPGTVPIWNSGLHGENEIIGVIDSHVVDVNHCFFQDNVDNTIRPAHRKVVGLRNASGSAVGDHATFVAGIALGDDFNSPGASANRGMAWAARMTYGNNDDLGTESLLGYLTAAALDGAAIHTNSWHDEPTPQYSQVAADVDTFVWNNEDNLVLGSSGNVGESIGPPGTAKNALCVSATARDPGEMNFGDGNNGPTPDGRRKPELMAPGCSIMSAQVGTACTIALDSTVFGFGPICATSWATPAAAGAAALVRQYYCEGFYPTGTQQPHHVFTPTGALLKATLLNSTLDMTGIAGYPGDQEGWGLIRLQDVLHVPGSPLNLRVWDTRNSDGLNTGDTRIHHVDVASNAQRLKVTLVWSDPPGATNAATPVVNNLDLQVVSPDGTQTFLGNAFSGGVSTTGGTADALNNVEMVLVNTPAPGEWTIRVIGTAVNVGNPGQGYALVVTADLTEPPVATGVQDTLVTRVKFADVTNEPSLANLQNLMTDVADYISEVSYGSATVVPEYRGPLLLDHNKDYYYHPDRNLLIELTQEVVSKLVTAQPTVFDTIERLIIVTNDINFTGDWATTGPWPYDMPAGFTRPISVSIQSYDNSAARFSHGLLHQLGLVDLYPHEGVVFPRPYVDEWDNMGGQFNNAHPLVWSKERAGWLTAHGDTVTYIPRPAAGGTYTGPNPLPIFRTTSTAANRKAIAIGLSQGAATIAAENVFYFVEARNNAGTTHDSTLPGTGVLIYYVNELVPQGEGPVILRDKNLLTPALNDAFFTVGDVVTIPGTGITLTIAAGTGGADFNIQVAYTAPVTDYNVFITRGDTVDGQFYNYFSPDIWVDSPRNGFNLSSGPPPASNPEKPVAGQVNRIYARVHNAGPATAFDFDVRFRISEPYHTVGGDADFNRFVGIKHVASLGPGAATGPELFVEWTPVSAAEPHACVKVDVINLVGTDTNPNDNWAQENLEIVASVTSSPFHPVTFSYNLTNPYDREALFYFRASGAPVGWTVNLSPRKIRLTPGQQIVGQATITPPEDAKLCTSERVEVTSWTPRGDTLINVGGAVVQVDLRRPTAITLEGDAGRCSERDWEILIREAKEREQQIDIEMVRKRCGRIVVRGCLVPPLAGEEVILKYVDPLGNVTYRTVTTDANGCFEDFMVSVSGGTWQVSAEYPGGKCDAPVVTGPISVCWCRDEQL
jgi:M6 family metalloprotease-like protein